jgi:signal transduction histidine kinase
MPPQDTQDLTIRGLVHDLNNVFQTIQDSADLLSDDPRWSKVAGALHRSSEHGLHLLRSVLEASEATFDFAAIAASSVQFARDVLQATHRPPVDFHTEVEEGLRLRGNTAGWERILVNLLLNSADAMPNGGRVELSARHSPDGVLVRVADNGPGIPEHLLPFVFEPYVSTKPASSSGPDVHGLGLHIVRSMVQLNGGRVSVRNREAGGAEFVILNSDDQG